jgi:hypothetical protein
MCRKESEKMDTNQDKAKEILGEENYYKLVENGFMPIEMSNLKVLLNTKDEIRKLNKRLDEIEKS